MNPESALSTHVNPSPFAITTLEGVKEMAAILAEANMYGLKQPAQFISLMMRAHEEGITLARLMERVHVFPDGKFANRADWLQAEFEEKAGRIIWHTRTDDLCVATFILGKEISDEQRARASERFELLSELDALTWEETRNAKKERELQIKIGKIAREGEETVLRSLVDADSKGISQGKDGTKTNWATSPRSMLQWRCVSEGVKVVCPRILSGMPSNIEYQDAIDYERHKRAMLENAAEIKPEDREHAMAILEQYDEQLKTAQGHERQRILGLRADLVTKLGDANLPAAPTEPEVTVAGVPAKMVETVVMPPEPKQRQETQSKQPRDRTRTTPKEPQPDNDDKIPMEAKDIECIVGPAPQYLGRTLGSIFSIGDVTKAPKNERQVTDLLNWFGDKQGLRQETEDRRRIAFWKAVQEVAEQRKREFAAASPERSTAPASPSTPTAAENTGTGATPSQRWQDYEIKGRNIYAGKKLGDLTGVELADIRDNLFEKVDWSKATLDQKRFKAMVHQAIGTLPDSAPEKPMPTAGEEAQHTINLKRTLAQEGWHAAIFLTTCKINGWVAEDHRSIDDITSEEMDQLAQEWTTVKPEIDAAHKGAEKNS
jgi:hypothetical protein